MEAYDKRKHSVGGTTLHTCHPCRRAVPYRIYGVIHTCGILALMYHHVNSLLTADTTLITSLLLFSDVILAFMWATSASLRFNPVHRSEYPEMYAAKPKQDFPKLDVFICTANPYKEPPMMVVNTALSAMAYDYPSDKISVYVSDDGGSSLTLFALMEAAKFSKRWLPYCKNNNFQDRSPEVYFSSKSHTWNDEADNLKMMYEDMKSRVEHVVDSGKVETEYITCDQFRGVFDLWTQKFTRQEHPTIIQVLQNSETDVDDSGKYIMPNLIYVSREKSKVSPHHFKAGALNTLLRVSGVMTNSPVILTLDCDMYSNDPTTPKFQGVRENDIYACEYKRLFDINMIGFDGLMGPNHVGTGCFFNRRVFYGPPSNMISAQIDELNPNRIADKSIEAKDVLELAHNVAGCSYEYNTNWGSKMGFRYGSLVEDYYTGYMLHCEGWRSVFCSPKRAAFCGDVPKSLIDVVSQQKRWAIGLLEVSISRYSPLTFGIKSMGILMGIGYCQYAFWAFWSIPLIVYGVLPQLALLYGVSVFPKSSDPWFWLYIFLFFGAYAQDLLDFVLEGGTYGGWWNDQRMWMIRGFTSFFFGSIEFTLKTLNLSTHGFNLTSKANGDDEQGKRYEKEIFDFGPPSSMFLPLTAAAIVNLFAFVWGTYGFFIWGERLVLELMLASFAAVNCLPIYEAMMLRNDAGKLPKRASLSAGILTFALIVSGYFFLK
ncbi:cellulose synthase-like protein G3 isoform X2 [Brassica napus]|uniref:cellulose synthase-like protein G3 isoform X2 n=1 Tax=Brassica napus TaxID=3708 RepID=UPI00207A1BA1|nr:cellulose synthase-like protein G3 isoform X2 [Brassica napus]